MKKIFYCAATFALLFGMTACGGNSKENAENAEDTEYAVSEDDDELDTDDEDYDDESSDSDSGSSLINSSELSTFISKGKSGDINTMIEALEWKNKVEAELKPQVRALNEDAIKAKIAIDKADEEIGEKYDTYSLIGALSNKTGEMSNAQLTNYNSACGDGVVYFTIDEDVDEYTSLYRKLRYDSPF